MTNVQYITDAAGHKTAVILQIEDYEKTLSETKGEEFLTNKLSDFESVQKFLVRQLVFSILDKTFELLEIPVDHSSRRKGDVSLLLFALVEYFYYSENPDIDVERYELTLMDTEFSRFLVSIERKTIQTQRNEYLIPYLKNNKKSIVEIYQHESSNKKGTTYRLNFLEALEKAVVEFFRVSNLELREINFPRSKLPRF